MQLGVALDFRLGLSFAEQRAMAREAADLGYSSAWTPALTSTPDAFHVCAQWWGATAGRPGGGIQTGISVVSAPNWTAPTLALQAATVSELTGGRFILGIGTGGIQDEGYRRSFGLPPWPPLALMRDYLTVLRTLLAGEAVDYKGRTLELHGVKLGWRPPPTPLYLAAMGPQMLRLAGALADGAMPNWSTPEQLAWCRERVAEGAREAGRDPGGVQLAQYIRVCVDEDVPAARRAFGLQVLGYAMARPGSSKEHGYRGHFARMGFDPVLSNLERRREGGESMDALVDALPDDLLLSVGYVGPPDGAAEALRRLSRGLDAAIVRIIAVRPGPDAVRVAMRACRPELVLG